MSLGPLVFCATDAGGARNLAPVAALAASSVMIAASEATVPLFAECGLVPSVQVVNCAADAAALIARVRPRALLCGTSRYIAAERLLTVAARERAVPSIAVLDEWFNYRTRFADETGGLEFLTDLIACPDRMARDEAVGEGLPTSRLVVTGSPSLAALADKIAGFAKAPPAAPECWQGSATGQRILFLSETHLLDYGSGPDRPGPLGPWLGYTEQDVRAALGRALAKSGMRATVVEKLHPSATDVPSSPEASLAWHVVTRAPLWPLIWHADLVIGMRSMALLEAALMGHRPLSFQPNLQREDRCTAARLGLADRARHMGELADWLRAPPPRGGPRRPMFADGRSAGNVLDAALRLAGGKAATPAAAST